MTTPQFTQSSQPPLRLVTVNSFTSDGLTALCSDRSGFQVSVPLFYQKAKGILPLAGEQWYVSNASGVWLFDTFVGETASQFPTQGGGGGGGGGGTPSAFAQSVFSYSGTPQAGNPPAAYVSTAGKDTFGNVTPYVASFGKPSSIAVDGNGNALVLNHQGLVQAAIAPEQGTYSAGFNLIEIPVLVYSAAPGPGNLILSLSGQSGTDKYGNQYPQGFNAAPGSIPASLLTGTVPGSVQPIGGTSLNFNPYLAGGDLTGWVATGAAMSATQVPQGPYPWSIQLVSTSTGPAFVSQPGYPIKVTPNTQYQVVGWEYINATAVQAELGITWLSTPDPTSAISTSTQAITITPSTWDPISAVFTSPPGANYAFPVAGTAGSTGPGMLSYVQAILLLPQVPGGLIQAGTITAAQIAANTITAANIAAGTITAGQIAAGTITAVQLAAGIIYAGIVNGTIITGATIVADGTAGNFLVYSGPPTKGNMIAEISAAGTVDPYGNQVLELANFGVWSPVTGNLRNHFGIDGGGNTYVVDNNDQTRIFTGNNPPRQMFFNNIGQTVGEFDPNNGAIWQYQDVGQSAPQFQVVQSGNINLFGTSTDVFTLPAPTTQGNSVVIVVRAQNGTANGNITGGTIGIDTMTLVQNTPGAVGIATMGILLDSNTAGGQTTVTINYDGTGSGGSQSNRICWMEVQGILTPGNPIDQTPAGTSGTSTTSWNSPTIGTANFTYELEVAIGTLGTSAGAGGVYTFTDPSWVIQQNNAAGCWMAFKIIGQPKNTLFQGTFSVASPYVSQCVTLKLSGGPVGPTQQWFAQVAAAPTASSLTINMASSVTPGNTLVATVLIDGTGANSTVSGITIAGIADNWTRILGGPGGGDNHEMWYDPGISPGTFGSNQVVVSWSGGGGTQNVLVWVSEWPNLLLASGLDQQVFLANASGSPWSATTPALSQANEVAIAFVDFQGTSGISINTPGYPWVNNTPYQGTSAASEWMQTAYMATPNANAVTYSGTSTGAGSVATVGIATFKLQNQGQLVFAQTTKPTFDPINTTAVSPGITLLSNQGRELYIDMSPRSGQPGMTFFTGNPPETAHAAIVSTIANPGAGAISRLNIFGPGINTHVGHGWIILGAAANDNSFFGGGQLFCDDATTTTAQISWGSGTWGAPQGASQKQMSGPLSIKVGSDVFTRTTTSNSFTAITVNYSIPSGDPVQNNCTYKLRAFGGGTWPNPGVAGAFAVNFFNAFANIQPSTFFYSSGFLTAGALFQWNMELDFIVTNPGASAALYVKGFANFSQNNGGASATYACTNIQGVGCNTAPGSAGTLNLGWQWASVPSTGSISCDGSNLVRVG